MTHGLKSREHLKTEDRYQSYRDIAYEVTVEEFPGIEAKPLNYVDALTADRWKDLPPGSGRPTRASWQWTKEYPFYRNRPNRFEITFWKEGVLGAICYGQLSRNGTRMRMNLIESTPVRPTPLGRKALPILSFAAAAFADIVGATELWVLDPDPRLEGIYRGQGFGDREIYHGRRVGQRRIL
ncbi:hypothetical protein [Mangrovitalea sediminis]|uniref:hypothetical protein n=1 Tax=Mangrovitalea sediminis TaxID=1982043 RepID=UPI000BE53B70|nr:hypothetical protein [Mangrovitalea sediminis]